MDTSETSNKKLSMRWKVILPYYKDDYSVRNEIALFDSGGEGLFIVSEDICTLVKHTGWPKLQKSEFGLIISQTFQEVSVVESFI